MIFSLIQSQAISNGENNTAESANTTWFLSSLPWISLSVIIVAILVSFLYLEYLRKNDRLTSQRRTVEYLPNLVSTLGVLGTFLGITVGLYYFNTSDLTNSIPKPLDSLKNSLLHIIGWNDWLVALSWYLNKHHEDGNKLNNKESNLECLCIRCHAGVDETHRKNISKGAKKVMMEEFINKYS